MSLVRWDPFRELEDMSNHLNRIFGRSTLSVPSTQEITSMPDWNPSVDIAETPEEYQIKAELPEVKREDVHLSVADGVLRLTGERKQEREEKGRKYHRVERHYGAFTRAFTLPENVDASRIRADFKDGMLSVRMPKAAVMASKTTEIKIA
jgi:HSP20 family protein